ILRIELPALLRENEEVIWQSADQACNRLQLDLALANRVNHALAEPW
ncbi:MAG: hypothetical protein RL740_94, partial [Actinomycetota bacterium]